MGGPPFMGLHGIVGLCGCTACSEQGTVYRESKGDPGLSPLSGPTFMGRLGGFRPSLVSTTTCSGSAPRKEGPLSQATGTLSPLDRRQETFGLSKDFPQSRSLGCFSSAGNLGRHPQRRVPGCR